MLNAGCGWEERWNVGGVWEERLNVGGGREEGGRWIAWGVGWRNIRRLNLRGASSDRGGERWSWR